MQLEINGEKYWVDRPWICLNLQKVRPALMSEHGKCSPRQVQPCCKPMFRSTCGGRESGGRTIDPGQVDHSRTGSSQAWIQRQVRNLAFSTIRHRSYQSWHCQSSHASWLCMIWLKAAARCGLPTLSGFSFALRVNLLPKIMETHNVKIWCGWAFLDSSQKRYQVFQTGWGCCSFLHESASVRKSHFGLDSRLGRTEYTPALDPLPVPSSV